MNREIHVRFWESLGVRFPRATHFANLRGGEGCLICRAIRNVTLDCVC